MAKIFIGNFIKMSLEDPILAAILLHVKIWQIISKRLHFRYIQTCALINENLRAWQYKSWYLSSTQKFTAISYPRIRISLTRGQSENDKSKLVGQTWRLISQPNSCWSWGPDFFPWSMDMGERECWPIGRCRNASWQGSFSPRVANYSQLYVC